MLRFDRQQIAGVDERRLEKQRRDTEAYLTQHLPEETGALSPTGLRLAVVDAESYGFRSGLETQAAHLLLAYLSLSTQGALLADDLLATQLRASLDADAEMEQVFDGFVGHLQRDDD